MSCSEVRYEVDGVHGVSYIYVHEDLDERGWTPVVKKRRRRSVQSPRQSPLKVNSSEALSTEGSCGEDMSIPSGSVVKYRIIDEQPGLQIRKNRWRDWTPISANTRSKTKSNH